MKKKYTKTIIEVITIDSSLDILTVSGEYDDLGIIKDPDYDPWFGSKVDD